MNLSFHISNARTYFEQLLEDHQEFIRDPLSSRHALTCALKAWHLTEWVYHEFHNTETETVSRNNLITSCPSLTIMRDLADAAKHCVLSRNHQIATTNVVEGDFDPNDFESSDYYTGSLVIIKNDGTQLEFEKELSTVIDFWIMYFGKLASTTRT